MLLSSKKLVVVLLLELIAYPRIKKEKEIIYVWHYQKIRNNTFHYAETWSTFHFVSKLFPCLRLSPVMCLDKLSSFLFFLGHHPQTFVTHNIWRPRRVSYPRWRLRWQERWWLTGPRPPWWPDSFGDETSSSARSGRGSAGEERDARCLTQTLHDKGGGGG